MGLIHVRLAGFSSLLWAMAIAVFIADMMLTLALERNEFNLQSLALAAIMLFTYAKLWMLVAAKAVYLSITDQIFHRAVQWDKTVRYAENSEDNDSEFHGGITPTGGQR
jgi:hypothetical protein